MFSVLLLALALCARGRHSASSFQALQYQPGTTYSYDYAFTIDQSQQAKNGTDSKISTQLKVHMEPTGQRDGKLFFRMRLSGFVSEEEDDVREYYEDLIKAHPAFFTMLPDGTLADIRFERRENEWAMNLKRGILSVFQVKTDSAEEYEAYETDASGAGSAMYRVLDSDKKRIMKTKQFFGRMMTARDHSRVQAIYTLSSDSQVVERIEVEDDHFMSFSDETALSAKGNGLMVLEQVKPNAQFVSVGSLDEAVTLQGGDYFSTTLSLVQISENDDDDYNVGEPTSAPEDDRIRFYYEAQKLTEDPMGNPGLFRRLTLMLQEDRRLVNDAKNMLKTNPGLRPILIDLLIGSENQWVIQFVLDDLTYNHPEAVEDMVRAITMTAYATHEGRIVTTLNWLMEHKDMSPDVKTTAALSLGAVIYRQSRARRWLDKQSKHGLWVLENCLKAAKNESEVVLYLHALGNAGQAYQAELIKSYLTEEHSEAVRLAALTALRRMDSSQVREFLLEIVGSAKYSFSARHVALDALKVLSENDLRHLLASAEDDSLFQAAAGKANQFVMQSEDVFRELETRASRVNTVNMPLFEKTEEFILVGSKSFGASVGYRALLNNPLAPEEDEEGERIVAKASTYGRIAAFNRNYPVFDAMAAIQGDVLQFGKTPKPIEGYVFVAIGDVVWRHCLDLFGEACGKKVNQTIGEDGCTVFRKPIINFNAGIFGVQYPIPLIFGIHLNIGVSFAAHVGLSAHGEFCGLQKAATAVLVPQLGLDAIADSRIDVFFARAGVSIDAKLFYTDFPVESKLALFQWPVSYCVNVDVTQDIVHGEFMAYAQVRDKVIRCGRRQIPCWLEWGHRVEWKHEWPGFNFSKWQKHIYDKCLQYPN